MYGEEFMKLELFIAISVLCLFVYFYFNPVTIGIQGQSDFQAYERRNLLEGIDVKPQEQ
jgi:dolichyl-phosphate-mannose--protein O-mannosyl transferase